MTSHARTRQSLNNLTSLNKWASTSAARCWPSTSTPAGRDQWLPPWAIAVLRTISPQVSTNQSGKAFMPPMVRASTIRSWSDGIPDWRRNRFPSIPSSFPKSFCNLDGSFSGTWQRSRRLSPTPFTFSHQAITGSLNACPLCMPGPLLADILHAQCLKTVERKFVPAHTALI